MDGTLVYFAIDYLSARMAVLEYFEGRGFPTGYLTTSLPIMEQVGQARDHFTSQGLSPDDLVSMMADVDQIVQSFEMEAARGTRAVDGIGDILKFCANSGLKQAVWTLNHSKIAEFTLDRTGLHSYFEVVVGRDAVTRPKPALDHLQAILSRLNLHEPKRALVVGDHPMDVEGGLLAGTYTVGVVTPRHDRSEFEKADWIISQDSMHDFVTLLQERFVLPRQSR